MSFIKNTAPCLLDLGAPFRRAGSVLDVEQYPLMSLKVVHHLYVFGGPWKSQPSSLAHPCPSDVTPRTIGHGSFFWFDVRQTYDFPRLFVKCNSGSGIPSVNIQAVRNGGPV